MKSYLIFADYQTCFLGDSILAGLYEQDDIDVYEHPRLAHVRGGVDQGYDLPGEEKKGFTSTPSYLSNPLPESRHSQEDILDNARNFDLVVMLSCRDYAVKGIRWFLEKTGLITEQLPLVICDGEDYYGFAYESIDTFTPKVYFKRELTKDSLLGHSPNINCQVWPLPFSAFSRSYPQDIDDQHKELDLFLSLGFTCRERGPLIQGFLEYAVDHNLRHWIALEPDTAMKLHPYYQHMKTRQDWFGYLRKQASAKIGASMRGFGMDTLHAWELFSFETAALYCPPAIQIPYPPEDGKHCLYFREDCSDLKPALDFLLDNEPFRQQIAREGKKWLYQHHTNQARTKYLIDIARRVLGGQKIEPEEFGLRK